MKKYLHLFFCHCIGDLLEVTSWAWYPVFMPFPKYRCHSLSRLSYSTCPPSCDHNTYALWSLAGMTPSSNGPVPAFVGIVTCSASQDRTRWQLDDWVSLCSAIPTSTSVSTTSIISGSMQGVSLSTGICL